MPDITVSDESGIALVRLTKPPANAFDPDPLAEGLRASSELRHAEPDAIVFTGQDRFFSGGLDAITATASRDPLADDWLGSDRVAASAAVLGRDGP